MKNFYCILLIIISSTFCATDNTGPGERIDGAIKIDIKGLPGSLQNPAWSPSGNEFVITNFRDRYNDGNAYLYIHHLDTDTTKLLLEGYNVNMPGGACIWHPLTEKIVFSSERNGQLENAYQIKPDGTGLAMITNQPGYMAWEPSFSPDGTWIVYERVKEDDSEHHIYKCEVANPINRVIIDDSGDCRQPSWSPQGGYLCYQKKNGSKFDITICNSDGSNKRNLLDSNEESTDCSFSPDGNWVVLSSEYDSIYANIFICPSDGGPYTPTDWIRVTNDPGYDGAPGWSQDGTKILFEHTDGDPDISDGATIWMINIPVLN
jgi:TolB protein